MAGAKSGTARKLLSEYRRKRDFKKTSEPSGEKAATWSNMAVSSCRAVAWV